MNLLPEIGEEVIQAWVGNKAFQRGYRYYEDGAILNPRKRGTSLIAECQGSQPTPYRVEVRLGPGGIERGDCSCPAGEGGHCKHAAALLLTWIYEPVSFTDVPDLEPELEKLSQQDLIGLIRQMVARHPDLEQLLEVSALARLDPGESLKPEFIAQQVRRAFTAAGGEMGDPAAISRNLQPVLDLGQDFLERDDTHNAGVVFQTLMETLLTYEDSLYKDRAGDLGQALSECEQGVEDCLEDLQDPQMRLSLLRTLFDFYLWDLTGVRRHFADETPLILAEQSLPEEKQEIAAWVQAALKEALPESEDPNIQKSRRKLGGLWLEVADGALNDDSYLTICRETGRTQDMVDRLLALGLIDEALAAAQKEPTEDLLPMADLFEKYGYSDLGWRLVKDDPESDTDVVLLQWLQQYAVRHNRPDEALELSERLFWQQQTLENYNSLVECADDLGRRDEIRARVLEKLESAGNYSLLVEIHLTEHELDLALAALERVNPEIWLDRVTVLRGKVAQAVEIPRPREAIRQYLLVTENLIQQRNRGSYAEAARFLTQVRKLYLGLGEPESWRRLIGGFNQEYSRLPALHDEFRRAGLLDIN